MRPERSYQLLQDRRLLQTLSQWLHVVSVWRRVLCRRYSLLFSSLSHLPSCAGPASARWRGAAPHRAQAGSPPRRLEPSAVWSAPPRATGAKSPSWSICRPWAIHYARDTQGQGSAQARQERRLGSRAHDGKPSPVQTSIASGHDHYRGKAERRSASEDLEKHCQPHSAEARGGIA